MGAGPGRNDPLPVTRASSHVRLAASQTRWNKSRRRLSALRESLYRRRLSLKEKRNEIKEERIFVDEITAKFFASVNQSFELGTALDESQVRDLYTEYVSKKDKLGALQYEYDEIEEDYDEAEDELNEREDDPEEFSSDAYAIDYATHSSHSDREARTANIVNSKTSNIEQIEHFPRLHLLSSTHTQRSPSPTSSIHYSDNHVYADPDTSPSRTSGIHNSNKHVYADPDTVQVIDDIGHSVKEDSQYDILEATFFMRTRANLPLSNVSNHSSEPQSIKLRGNEAPGIDYVNLWEIASHPTSIQDPDLELSEGHDLQMRPTTHTDSGMTTLRRGLIRRQSRITWWHFNTFGSSIVDYLERASDKRQLRTFRDPDEDYLLWAQLVFEHWTSGKTYSAVDPASGNDDASTKSPVLRHVEPQRIGDTWIYLPSGRPMIRQSVDDVDRLF